MIYYYRVKPGPYWLPVKWFRLMHFKRKINLQFCQSSQKKGNLWPCRWKSPCLKLTKKVEKHQLSPDNQPVSSRAPDRPEESINLWTYSGVGHQRGFLVYHAIKHQIRRPCGLHFDRRHVSSSFAGEVGVWSVNSGNIYTRNWKWRQCADIPGTALIQSILGWSADKNVLNHLSGW